MGKRGIRLVAMFLVFILIIGDGGILYAMPESGIRFGVEPVSEEFIDGDSMPSEEDTEAPSEDNKEESSQEETEVSEEEDFVGETRESEGNETGESAVIIDFPGLPEDWVFTAEDNEQRRILAEHAEDEGAFEEGTSCVSGEILVSAGTEEIAEISGTANLSPDSAVLIGERQRACAERALDGVNETDQLSFF